LWFQDEKEDTMKSKNNAFVAIGLMLFSMSLRRRQSDFPGLYGTEFRCEHAPGHDRVHYYRLGIPLLGVAAIGLTGQDLPNLASRVHPWYADFSRCF